jgi:hypothetical protein
MKKGESLPGAQELRRLLLSLCSGFPRVLFFVFDALDESDENLHRPIIREFIQNLIHSRVRLLITSRAYPPDINHLLGSCTSIKVSASPDDIRSFVLDRIAGSARMARMIDEELKEEIVTKIVAKSQGM